MMDSADRQRDWWFRVIWKMIWHLWHSDSLDRRPFCTLLRGVLDFLRFARVLLGILVICVISLRECLPPWINPGALLHRLGIHSAVCMMYSGGYQKIEALFITVVVVGWLKILVVSRNLVIVPSLSVSNVRRQCPPVEPNRGVNQGPTGFFRFRIEFELQFF